MIVIAPTRQEQVVAWNPFREDSDLVASSKHLDAQKIEKFKDSISSFVEFLRSEPNDKQFNERLQGFELATYPIVSGASTVHEELVSRGLPAPFKVKDPVTGKVEGIDVIYMSLFDLDRGFKATAHGSPQRRQVLAAMAARMTIVQRGIEAFAAKHANPRFIQLADQLKYVDLPEEEAKSESAPPKPAPTAPEATPEKPKPPSDAPYFSGEDSGARKEHQGKSKSQLQSDVLDAIRANRGSLPDDLKKSLPKLIDFFKMKSSTRTAGMLDQVYGQRKNDVSKLLRLFFGADYDRVKEFENGVLSWLEKIWDVEDFPEVEPKSIDEIMSIAREMIDRGDEHGKVVSELAKMLAKASEGKETDLDNMLSTRKHFFQSIPELSEAVEKARSIIKGGLSTTPKPAVPSLLPTPAPASPAAPAPVKPPRAIFPKPPVPVPLPVQKVPQTPSAPAPAKEANPQQPGGKAPFRVLRRLAPGPQ